MKKFLIVLFVLFFQTLIHANSCNPKLVPIISKIQQLPEGRMLIKEINQEGPIRFMVGDNKIARDFGACWEVNQRILLVNLDYHRSEGGLIASILFELQNARMTSQFRRLDWLVMNGKIKKKDYIREIEKIEYHNSIRASQMAQKGVARGIFPRDTYLPVYSSFEEHFKYQQIGKHSDVIASNYDNMAPQSHSRFGRIWNFLKGLIS